MAGFGSLAPGQDDENALLDDWKQREATENLAAQQAADRPSGLSTMWQAIKHPSLYPMYKALTSQQAPQPQADTSNLPDVGPPLISPGPQISAGTAIGNALTGNLPEAAWGAVKSGVTAPGEALSGRLPMYTSSGEPNPDVVQRALDMSALMGGASVAGTAERAAARAPGEFRVLGKQLLSEPGKPAAAEAVAAHAPAAAAPAFTTSIEPALERIPSKELTGLQWLNQLKRFGAKPEEMDWRQLGPQLEQNANAKIPREAIASHAAENPVELTPIVKQNRKWEELTPDEQYRIRDMAQDRYRNDPYGYAEPQNAKAYYEEMVEGESLPSDFPQPEYSIYQVPGGERYRERLMQIPQNEPKMFGIFSKSGERLMPEMQWAPGDEAATNWVAEAKYPNAERDALLPMDAYVRQIGGHDYVGSHWKEPNVVFHRRSTDREFLEPLTRDEIEQNRSRQLALDEAQNVRAQIGDVTREINRTRNRNETVRRNEIWAQRLPAAETQRRLEQIPDMPELKPLQDKLQELRDYHDRVVSETPEEVKQKGTLSLHDEENQSDWHQQGRDKGYGDPNAVLDRGEPQIVEQHPNMWRINWPDGTFSGGYGSADEAQMAANQRRYQHAGYVPDAPFKGTGWERLALHDQLREAAEKGYPRISWTAGEANPTNPLVMLSEGNNRLEELPATRQQEILRADKGIRDYYDRRRVDQANKIGKAHGVQVQRGALPNQGGMSGSSAMQAAGIHPLHQQDFWEHLNDYHQPALVPSGDFEGQRMTRNQFFDAVRQKGIPAYYMDIPDSLRKELLTKPMNMFAEPGDVAMPAAMAAHLEQDRMKREMTQRIIERLGRSNGTQAKTP